MSVPPSLLASACLCDSIAHLAKEQYSKCTEKLSQLAGVELVGYLPLHSSMPHKHNMHTLIFVCWKCFHSELLCHFSNKDVLVQHQHNVSDVYNRKIQSFSSQPNTPTNIEDIEEKEFGSRQSVSWHLSLHRLKHLQYSSFSLLVSVCTKQNRRVVSTPPLVRPRTDLSQLPINIISVITFNPKASFLLITYLHCHTCRCLWIHVCMYVCT